MTAEIVVPRRTRSLLYSVGAFISGFCFAVAVMLALSMLTGGSYADAVRVVGVLVMGVSSAVGAMGCFVYGSRLIVPVMGLLGVVTVIILPLLLS